MRKYYLDNLRWISILLLIPYHTCMIYNNWGEDFYIKSNGITALSGFIQICSPWFMPLLFVIAGVSSCYALEKRTSTQYLKERVIKLLVPLISGILLLVPIQTYYAEKFHNGYNGGYLHQYILFFTKKTDLTGVTGGFTPAQLWFILYLFLISLLALPLMKKHKNSGIELPIDKLSLFTLFPMFLITVGMSFILNIGGKSLGEYFTLFMLGYFIFSEDKVQELLERNRWYLFSGFVLLTAMNLYYQNMFIVNFGIVYSIYYKFLSWIGILTLIGLGRYYLNFHNQVTQYLSKSSFTIYIFHQSILILIAYYVLQVTSFVILQVVLIIIGCFALTMLAYEIFKRISITRFLFAIKK